MRLEKTADYGHSGYTLPNADWHGALQQERPGQGSIAPEIGSSKYPSVLSMCEDALKSYAHLTAFYSRGNGLRYQQVDDLSLAFAAYLQNTLGVQKGSRVAIIAPNILAVSVSFVGALRCGAVLVNINPTQTVADITQQLDDAHVDVVVLYQDYQAEIQQAVAAANVRHVIIAGETDLFSDSGATESSSLLPKNGLPFSEAIAAGASLQLKPISLSADDLLFVDYSAESAEDRMLNHRHFVENTEQFIHFMPSSVLPSKEVLVSVAGVYQSFSLMLSIIYFSIGSENHLLLESDSLDQLLDTLSAARPTIFPAVSGLFEHLENHPRIHEIDWSALKLSMCLDKGMSAEQCSAWQQLTGSFVHEGYGVSAKAPLLSLNQISVNPLAKFSGLPSAANYR